MKKMLPYVFTIFFPYYMVLLICSLFSHQIMKSVFHDNFYLGILYLFILWVIALISVIVLNVKHFMKKTEAVRVASINMVIKIAQIPAYVFIFVAGLACLLTIFTFGISIVFVILDCASIFLSGLVGVSAVMRCHEEGILGRTEMVVHGVLQFVFCLDVVSSVIMYRKAKVQNPTTLTGGNK